MAKGAKKYDEFLAKAAAPEDMTALSEGALQRLGVFAHGATAMYLRAVRDRPKAKLAIDELERLGNLAEAAKTTATEADRLLRRIIGKGAKDAEQKG